MPDFLSSLTLAGLGAALAAMLSLLTTWFFRRSMSLRRDIDALGKNVFLDLGDIEKTYRELEARVMEVRSHPQVFVSYAHEDSSFVRRLAEDLKTEGVRVWLDVDQLRVGDRIPLRLQQGLRGSQWVLQVVSGSTTRSTWARKEMEMALEDEQRRGRPTVLPLLVSPNAELPEGLKDRVYADFSLGYAGGLSALLRSIQARSEEIDHGDLLMADTGGPHEAQAPISTPEEAEF